MAVQGFILVALAAHSLALWDSNSEISSWDSPSRGRAVPTQCSTAGVTCSNCYESYICSSDTATPVELPACESTQLCNGPSGFAACTDFMGDGVSAGDCDCDTIGNSGFLADPYDSSRYFICIPGGAQFLQTCDDGFVFSSETNTCVEETVTPTGDPSTIDCTSLDPGFYTNDPTCQTYTVCFSNTLPGVLLSCSDGEAFDTSIQQCVSECLLGPSAFACPTSGSGAFPDTSDCTIFHICSNGVLVFSDIQCPSGQLFESTSMACVAASTSVVCPEINDCWAAYCDACGTCPSTSIIPNPSSSTIIETPTPDGPTSTSTPDTTVTTTVDTPAGAGTDPPNCSNNPGYFEYAADCKQFWSCQDDDAGGYEAILYRCPGDLYFIPSSSYCSFQSDLPSPSGCTIV